MSDRRIGHAGNGRSRAASAWSLLLFSLLLAFGCSEPPSDPRARPASLGVRVLFPEPAEAVYETLRVRKDDDTPTRGIAAGGGSAVSVSEIEARAIELGEANVVRDEDSASLEPSETHFALRLVVPPAADYRVDVAARGTLGSEGSASEFGVIFFGQGFAMDVSAEAEQTVEVFLNEAVPDVGAILRGGEIALSWETIPGAIRYRIKETIGEEIIETAIAGTDTTIVIGSAARSFRVRAELGNGVVGAYSEAFETGDDSRGDLRVLVVDAQTGDPLPDALVTVLDRSQSTNARGIAEFADLPLGDASVTIALEGYIDGTTDVTIVAGRIATVQVVLSRALTDGYRVILTWGQEPVDLDSYLVTPLIAGVVDTIFWNNLGAEDEPPFAVLDHDDLQSFGPETITIHQSFPGDYRYFVYNYSRSIDPEAAPLAGSGATVMLIRGSEVINRIVVPSTGTGDYWNVFTLEPKSVTVVVLNEISEAAPAFSEEGVSVKNR